MRATDVAAAMSLPLRSYEHFEAGGGQLNIDRLFQFAEVTNSDPYAILFAVLVGTPDFAVRAADNKLGIILVLALQDFDQDLGDGIATIEAAALISRFTQAFTDLAAYARDREAAATAWVRRRRGEDDAEPDGAP